MPGERTIAKSFFDNGYRGISLNEKRLSQNKVQEFLFELKKKVEERFHPVGCDTIKSIIDHEICHQLDNIFWVRNDEEIIKLYREYHQPVLRSEINETMANALSSYANENIGEFVAEAWAEYRNNPTPRELSKAVGDRILEIIRSGIRHDNQ